MTVTPFQSKTQFISRPVQPAGHGLAGDAQRELIEGGYAPETPAAIVYKATWPDQKIFRCTVGTLGETVRGNGLTKTSLIVIGDFLGHDYERSKLYDPGFTTEFREAEK